jgi:parallel beta-helix repeat protein
VPVAIDQAATEELMNRMHIRRALAALCLAAPLSIAMTAAPASASGSTRWVDRDGHAGPNSCGGSATASKTIQKAVTASGPNDTVKVCPGTYVERVRISGNRHGLTLMSVTSHAAIIKAKADATFNTIVLLKITSVDNVTVKDFSIRPLRANSHDSCDDGDGITVSASANVSIQDNQIKPAGSGPFCGLFRAITATAGTTGTIHANDITDYLDGGIVMSGAGTNLSVTSNTITYAQVGLDPAGGAAIGLSGSAKGSVTGNTITGPASGPGSPSQPAAGVQLDGSGSGVNVKDNTIAGMAANIEIDSATGGTISGNTISGGQTSLDMQAAKNITVTGNTAHDATVYGIYLADAATGNNVHDNDFTTSKNFKLADCKGQSSTVVSVGSNNSFEDNKGDKSNPAAICAGRPPG